MTSGVHFFMRITSVFALGALMLGIGLCGCSKQPSPSQPSNQAAATVISKWEGKLVRRPGTTEEDGKVYLVQDGTRHWVVSGAWLLAHGYEWPGDVHQIPAEEFNAIPIGDMIE